MVALAAAELGERAVNGLITAVRDGLTLAELAGSSAAGPRKMR